jgi:S-DNA-T family DNA segregation ATPase FtsK/SpoIIIE
MLGRDAAGHPVAVDLEKMPHLLIAGATGSGKSVCITSIISTLLYRNSPRDMKLLLIDPKRVELVAFNDIPHLLSPVIVDKDKTINALRWAVHEMEQRYQLLNESHKRNIAEYNASAKGEEKLPFIIVIIDELADLMAAAAREVEGSIVRSAQMARAVGIHLIVATQRPSVDVITGLIKANITSRIAFAVASQVDSRTILDMSGAEKLLGNGDGLYLASDIGRPKRVQGVFVADKEIKSLTQFLRSHGAAHYDEAIESFHAPSTSRLGEGGETVDDELFEDAVEVVTRAKKASASLLQRRLRVGYARAARLLDILEERGVVGPADGSKPRDVLIDEGGKIEFEDH